MAGQPILLDVNRISSAVPPGVFTSEWRIVSAEFCSKPGNTTQNTVLHGLMLSFKKGTVSSNSRSNVNVVGSKKSRTSYGSTGYDARICFADLTAPPKTFELYFHSPRATKQFLDHAKTMIAVGGAFYIPEPDMSNKGQGDAGMVTISCCFPTGLIPLTVSNHRINIPEQQISIPRLPGEQLWFAKHKQPIVITNFFMAMQDASCRGKFCDRQESALRLSDKGCGCVYTSVTPRSIVADFSVQFETPELAASDSTMYTMQHFRSYRTTTVFFKSIANMATVSQDNLLEQISVQREKVHQMAEYITQFGGWTIVGWFKRGQVQDQSNPNEKVASEEVSFHIVYLMPTELDILEDEEFKKLMIDV